MGMVRLKHEFGISLDDVAQQNIAKLWARYPNGFSVEDSRKRNDQ